MHSRRRSIGRGARIVVIVNPCHSNLYVQGGKTIRRIYDSDVKFQRIVSSKVLSVSMGAEEQDSASDGTVRVRKVVQTAKIFQCPGETFTTTTIEPVDVNDREKVRMVSVDVWTKKNHLIIIRR